MLHGHDYIEMDMTHGYVTFLKIHTARVLDTCRTRHGSMIEVSVLIG